VPLGPSVGQVDLPSLHQPPREDQFRSAVRRRVARRYKNARSSPRASRTRSLPPAYRDRDGLPAFQPVPAHDGAGERRRGTGAREEGLRAVALRVPEACSTGSDCPARSTLIPTSSPASAAEGPIARGSRWSRSSCSSTSPPAPSILSSSAKSSTYAGLAEEGMTMVVVTHEIGFARERRHTGVHRRGRGRRSWRPARGHSQPQHERTKPFSRRCSETERDERLDSNWWRAATGEPRSVVPCAWPRRVTSGPAVNPPIEPLRVGNEAALARFFRPARARQGVGVQRAAPGAL